MLAKCAVPIHIWISILHKMWSMFSLFPRVNFLETLIQSLNGIPGPLAAGIEPQEFPRVHFLETLIQSLNVIPGPLAAGIEPQEFPRVNFLETLIQSLNGIPGPLAAGIEPQEFPRVHFLETLIQSLNGIPGPLAAGIEPRFPYYQAVINSLCHQMAQNISVYQAKKPLNVNFLYKNSAFFFNLQYFLVKLSKENHFPL